MNKPTAVLALEEQVSWADAVVIASPEYAHGVTGVMKNALDWLVGGETMVHKPVAVLNASPRATHADAALRETLTVMSAQIIEAASITLPILGSGLSEIGMAQHPHILNALHTVLQSLAAHFHQ